MGDFKKMTPLSKHDFNTIKQFIYIIAFIDIYILYNPSVTILFQLKQQRNKRRTTLLKKNSTRLYPVPTQNKTKNIEIEILFETLKIDVIIRNSDTDLYL